MEAMDCTSRSRPSKPASSWPAWSLVRFLALAVVVLTVFGRSATPADAATTVIVMVGQTSGGTTAADRYNLASITINVGDTVRWNWFSGSHDVQSYIGSFSSGARGGMNNSSSTYSVTFPTAGIYTYYCDEHGGPSDAEPARIDERIAAGKMVGKIVVVAGAGDTTPPLVSAVVASPNPTAGATTVALSATVADNIAVVSARYKVNGGAPVAMTLTGGSVSATVPVSGLAAGSHTLTVEALDAANNVGSAATTLSVTASGGGGGSLSFTSQPVAFGALQTAFDNQETIGSTAAWRAADATGSGAGWNLTVIATDMTSDGGTIAVANMRVLLVQAAVVTVSGNTAPQTQVPSYQPLSKTTPLKLLRATAGTGAGTYDFTPDFRLTVPAGTPPGTYTSSITVTMNSGP